MTAPAELNPDELQPLVQGWLPTQRWFAGKGRVGDVSVELLGQLSAAVALWLAHLHYEDGTRETYLLPLTGREQPEEFLEHVLLGTIEGDGRTTWIYDALHDKDLTASWLTLLCTGYTDDVLTFQRFVETDAIPVERPSLVLTGEQSNTSLMYGDEAILKVFRGLQPGVNPDIEIGQALGVRGARFVPLLLGSVTARYRNDSYAIAMLQEYMTTATDGWELAKASVRDLMAEADLHAEEAGGDFAGEAARLGAAVAGVHADLADAFGSEPLGDLRERASLMHQRLDEAVLVVPQLAELASGLHALYEAFAVAGSDGLSRQRVHGDLHLGQALRTSHRWVVIDFEGEPMTDLAGRRAPDSPLRDVAGMLRSFEYAGHHQILETGFQPQLAYRANEWAARNRDAFCQGYADAGGDDPRGHGVVLRAFEADKAVYEAIYEARNRPTWLALPLASLARLAQPEGAR
jgi:maltokinase